MVVCKTVPFVEWMKTRPTQHQQVVQSFLNLMHLDEIFHIDQFANNEAASRILDRGSFTHLKPSSRITYISRFVSSVSVYCGIRPEYQKHNRLRRSPHSPPTVGLSRPSTPLSVEEQFQEAWLLLARCPDLRVLLAPALVNAQLELL